VTMHSEQPQEPHPLWKASREGKTVHQPETIVMKFGGSSVADAAHLREVAILVTQSLPKGPLVVLSATAKTTDALIEAAHRAETGDLGAALGLSRDLQMRHRDIALELFPKGLPAVLARANLFQVFSRHQINVDLVATTESSVSCTVDGNESLEALLKDLAGFGTVGVARDRTIVAIVGERIKYSPGVTGRCFGALQEINIEMISLGASEINLSFVVKKEDATPALRALHAALITNRFFQQAVARSA